MKLEERMVHTYSAEREKFPPHSLQSAWIVHITLQFLRSAYRLSITWTQQSPWSVVGTS